MKAYQWLLVLLSVVIYGCASVDPLLISDANYKGYRAIDPLPVPTVSVFNLDSNAVTEVYWDSITNSMEVLRLLPNQTSEVILQKVDASGKLEYMTGSVTHDAGDYIVTMDYMKYRVEQVNDKHTDELLGKGRIGIGLRFKARLTTTTSHLNTGGLLAIAVEAKKGNLQGEMSVDIIGIDSAEVTLLHPLTLAVDESSIQTSLQAIASVKSKIWEDGVKLTPQLLAISDAGSDEAMKVSAAIAPNAKKITQSDDTP